MKNARKIKELEVEEWLERERVNHQPSYPKRPVRHQTVLVDG